MDAIEWWATYGAETPELAEVARKVLSQPVTTSSAERNWSTYSFIHNIKRNRLNNIRATSRQTGFHPLEHSFDIKA
ncbi:hypothetical protein FRX31_010174 [Thalictrum thalictroides]|uniref:HAT C-terminal dimerisation domain-containing protein n=1 Tax=Thalictrum thalictroides TaxID=46969 RepID=A0A7J6WU25_THATH|nr:hypothetical protein FRX31_010174 [Thalictrum thalictroides]